MIVYKASWQGVPFIKEIEVEAITALSVTVDSKHAQARQGSGYRYCETEEDAKNALLAGCHSVVCRRKVNVREAEAALKQAKLIQEYAENKFKPQEES